LHTLGYNLFTIPGLTYPEIGMLIEAKNREIKKKNKEAKKAERKSKRR
jgi:hypothetical protein